MNENNQRSRRHFIKSSVMTSAGLAIFPAFGVEGLIGSVDSKKTSLPANEFFMACEKGDLNQVKNLLDQHKELIDIKDDNWRSGFTIALLHYHDDIAKLIKEHGYQTDLHEAILDRDWDRYGELFGDESPESTQRMNKVHPMGGTSMWAAAAAGAGQDTWRVYAGNADPNKQSSHEGAYSPLQKALEYKDLKIAELTAAAMLSNDTNPMTDKNEHPSALHIAAQRGSTEMVEMLIRLGANPDMKDRFGRTPSQLADYYGQKEVFKILENHQAINRTCRTARYLYNGKGEPYSRPDMTELTIESQGDIVGSAHRDLEKVKKMLMANPLHAHSMATTSESAIEAGAHMGRKDIVETLLEYDAPYSMSTAVFMNDYDMVKKLLKEDPNRIHERGAHDFALLWYPIISGGTLEMTELLLASGATVEEQHFLGTTALHWACFSGQMDMIELLVENGANVNRVGRKFDPNGMSPLDSAKDEKVIAFLKSKGAH